MSAPSYQLKADFCTTLGHPARTQVLELLAGCGPPSRRCCRRCGLTWGGSGTRPGGYGSATWTGYGGAAGGLVMGMTRQYVAGELSVLL